MLSAAALRATLQLIQASVLGGRAAFVFWGTRHRRSWGRWHIRANASVLLEKGLSKHWELLFYYWDVLVASKVGKWESRGRWETVKTSICIVGWCYTGLAHWIHHPMLTNASVGPGQYHVAAIGQLCCETAPLQRGAFRRVMNMLSLGVQACLFWRSDHCLVFLPGLWWGSCVSVLPVHGILWFTFGRIQEGLWLFSWWFGLTASLGGKKGTLL